MENIVIAPATIQDKEALADLFYAHLSENVEYISHILFPFLFYYNYPLPHLFQVSESDILFSMARNMSRNSMRTAVICGLHILRNT